MSDQPSVVLVHGGFVVPSWFTRNVVNRVIAVFAKLGISVWGSRVLEVRGRKTGKRCRTPVNLLASTAPGISSLHAARRTGCGTCVLREMVTCCSVGIASTSWRWKCPTPKRRRFCGHTSKGGNGRSACSSAALMQGLQAKIFAVSRRNIRFSALRRTWVQSAICLSIDNCDASAPPADQLVVTPLTAAPSGVLAASVWRPCSDLRETSSGFRPSVHGLRGRARRRRVASISRPSAHVNEDARVLRYEILAKSCDLLTHEAFNHVCIFLELTERSDQILRSQSVDIEAKL